MVAQFEIRVTGDKAVASGLNRVSAAMGSRAVMPALRAAALIPQNASKGLVPRVTGTLMRSIHMEDVPGELAVVVGTDVDYARRIEFGFADTDSLGRTYNQPAQPYLRPALDENRGAIVQEFGEAIEDIVKAAFR